MSTISELRRSVEEFYSKGMNLSELQNGIARVDTPFLDRHNDSIILYIVKEKDNVYKVTDGGYTVDDLESDGLYLSKSKNRMHILKEQLNNFSVKISPTDRELYLKTSKEDYPMKQNLLIQAMLFTNDMFMLSNKKVTSIFINEVATFFEDHDIRVTDSPNIIGPSGTIHHYDFSIPGIKKIPEKLIKAMNSANNEYYAKSIAMDKRQTEEVKPNAAFYAIVNDENPLDSKIVNLFESENITTIPFSKRNDYVQELAK